MAQADSSETSNVMDWRHQVDRLRLGHLKEGGQGRSNSKRRDEVKSQANVTVGVGVAAPKCERQICACSQQGSGV